jgi:hypothetical protein
VLRALVVGGHGDRDPRAVRRRDAEQLAEHRDRERAGVCAEQVGRNERLVEVETERMASPLSGVDIG